MSLQETGFVTPPGRITALRSGDPKGPKVLALHGWLDNAASFVPLAAHLPHLDLVMLDSSGREGDTLVFVEVRYRQSAAFGGGAASVDAGKRRKLVHAAQLVLMDHPRYAQLPCRFDVVEAEGDPQAPRITWLRDAFRADDI